jgi:hypothetical protein
MKKMTLNQAKKVTGGATKAEYKKCMDTGGIWYKNYCYY